MKEHGCPDRYCLGYVEEISLSHVCEVSDQVVPCTNANVGFSDRTGAGDVIIRKLSYNRRLYTRDKILLDELNRGSNAKDLTGL